MTRHGDSWTCITTKKYSLRIPPNSRIPQPSTFSHFLMPLTLLPFLITLLFLPEMTFAVPPPDFIIQAVSQLALIFSLSVAFLSSVFFTFRQYFILLRGSKKFWYTIIGMTILLVSLGIAWIGNSLYQSHTNAKNIDSWMRQVRTSPEWGENMASGEIQEQSPHPIPSSKSESSTGSLLVNLSWAVSTGSVRVESTGSALLISNASLEKLLAWSHTDDIILDAREDLEYSIGHIPESLHIRFADLSAWLWSTLPKKKIIVVCWSGMRGKMVALMLKEHGVNVRYLEHGVDGWVIFGWSWSGEVKFSHVYHSLNYSLTFTTDEVLTQVTQWVRLIDARENDKYEKKHINGAIHISMLGTPSTLLEQAFSHVQRWDKVIVVCDDYINCFDAKIVGIELEKRWSIFRWRYTTPWQYPNHIIPHM